MPTTFFKKSEVDLIHCQIRRVNLAITEQIYLKREIVECYWKLLEATISK